MLFDFVALANDAAGVFRLNFQLLRDLVIAHRSARARQSHERVVRNLRATQQFCETVGLRQQLAEYTQHVFSWDMFRAQLGFRQAFLFVRDGRAFSIEPLPADSATSQGHLAYRPRLLPVYEPPPNTSLMTSPWAVAACSDALDAT